LISNRSYKIDKGAGDLPLSLYSLLDVSNLVLARKRVQAGELEQMQNAQIFNLIYLACALLLQHGHPLPHLLSWELKDQKLWVSRSFV
jgi:hypothetical protein